MKEVIQKVLVGGYLFVGVLSPLQAAEKDATGGVSPSATVTSATLELQPMAPAPSPNAVKDVTLSAAPIPTTAPVAVAGSGAVVEARPKPEPTAVPPTNVAAASAASPTAIATLASASASEDQAFHEWTANTLREISAEKGKAKHVTWSLPSNDETDTKTKAQPAVAPATAVGSGLGSDFACVPTTSTRSEVERKSAPPPAAMSSSPVFNFVAIPGSICTAMPVIRVLGRIEGPLASCFQYEAGVGQSPSHFIIGKGGLADLAPDELARLKTYYDMGMVIAVAHPDEALNWDVFRILEPGEFSFKFKFNPNKFALYAWRKIPKGFAEIAFTVTEVDAQASAGKRDLPRLDVSNFLKWVSETPTFKSYFNDGTRLALQSIPSDPRTRKVRDFISFLDGGGDIAMLNSIDLKLSTHYTVTSDVNVVVNAVVVAVAPPPYFSSCVLYEKSTPDFPFLGMQVFLTPAKYMMAPFSQWHPPVALDSPFMKSCAPKWVDTIVQNGIVIGNIGSACGACSTAQ